MFKNCVKNLRVNRHVHRHCGMQIDTVKTNRRTDKEAVLKI